MIRKAPARAAVSFILAPLSVLAMFIGWVAATEGRADAADPEGLAYLLAFTGFALPGLIVALVLTSLMQRRTNKLGYMTQLALAGLTGLVVTCATFAIVLEVVAGANMLSDPAVLVLPAAIGIVGCLTFVGLGGSMRMVA